MPMRDWDRMVEERLSALEERVSEQQWGQRLTDALLRIARIEESLAASKPAPAENPAKSEKNKKFFQGTLCECGGRVLATSNEKDEWWLVCDECGDTEGAPAETPRHSDAKLDAIVDVVRAANSPAPEKERNIHDDMQSIVDGDDTAIALSALESKIDALPDMQEIGSLIADRANDTMQCYKELDSKIEHLHDSMCEKFSAVREKIDAKVIKEKRNED
jgi:hypothetical protein